jgi:hypothetical protein
MVHELGHSLGGRHHHVAEYMAAERHEGESNEAFNGRIDAQFSSLGALDCPMRYWQIGRGAREKLLFASVNWNPGEQSPIFTPWAFCEGDLGQLRFYDEP